MSRSRPIGAALVESPDIDLIDIASPNDTHAEIAIAAAQAGKMVMCEKPLGRNAAESEAMVKAVEAAGVREHGLVQLPPRARRHAGQATDRRGPPRPHLPLSRQIPAGLDHLERSAAGRRRALASGRRRRRQRRHRRSAGALHRYRHVAERRHRRSLRHDRDLHQEPQTQPHRQGGAGGHRRCQRSSWRASTTDRWPPSKPPATPADTRRCTPSKSTASTRPSSGTCTICTACSISITATKAACAAGEASTSPIATIPT